VADLHDISISHAVDLAAYSNDVLHRVNRILDATDRELFQELLRKINLLSPSEFSLRRLSELLASVRRLNDQAYSMLKGQLELDLREIAVYESEFAGEMIRATGADMGVSKISPEHAVAAGNEKPLRGRLMKDWAESLGERRMQRIQDSLAMGFVEGRTVDEMTTVLRGTRAAMFKDGLLGVDRREAEALVRTAIGHYANAAREATFAANKDIIKTVMWVSTLDNRTSETCMVRDQMKYSATDHTPIGHSFPWLGGPGEAHWNCRSTSIPVLENKLGLGAVERASMDGPVPAGLTYGKWLTAQSEERQREILGASRATLMQDGKYTLRNFVNNKGRWLTLDELRTSDKKTFKRLGL